MTSVLKIAGCAGHGGYKSLNPKVYSTSGKRTPDGEPEWDFNNKVILAFEETLKQYENVEFLRTDDRTGRTDVPLKTRTNKANAWGADAYFSFHENGNTGKWGNWGGTETFCYGSGESLELAKVIHDAQLKAYGLRDRGVKVGKDLHIIRETNMPAVLLEGAFMDSTTDIVKLRDDNVLRNVGCEVAHAVAKYYGLKKKVVDQPMRLFNFYTGGYHDEALVEIHNYMKQTKWDFSVEISATGNFMFTIGKFGEGTVPAANFEKWLTDRGYAFEKRYLK
jgi:N-acetylmuramoyl-L-alanine amidase